MCDRTGELLNDELIKAVEDYKMYNVNELLNCTRMVEERAKA